MTNSLMVIHPYKHISTWVFDDPATGLVKEPFVAGIPEIIERLVGTAQKFTAIFSDSPFPDYVLVLKRRESAYDGTWYEDEATGMRGWLCPALFKYFADAPECIYLKVEV